MSDGKCIVIDDMGEAIDRMSGSNPISWTALRALVSGRKWHMKSKQEIRTARSKC